MDDHSELWRIISDYEILVGAVGAVVFAFSYGLFFRWTKTSAGRALMFFVLSLVVLFLIVGFARWFGPDYPGRPIITPIAYAGVSVAMWWLVFVLWRNWRRRIDPLDLNSRPRNKE